MTLPNYNGSMRTFIPNDMGGAASKDTTSLRDCHVVDGVVSTYVVPGDWQDDIKKWSGAETHFKSSPDNTVKYYCATDLSNAGGYDAFRGMKEAFDTATGEGHFILLLGWSHGLDFPLDGNTSTPAGSGNTMREIWTKKVAAKVKIRALFW